MTSEEKKAILEECLRKIGNMPNGGNGSVTVHVTGKKVLKIETRHIE